MVVVSNGVAVIMSFDGGCDGTRWFSVYYPKLSTF